MAITSLSFTRVGMSVFAEATSDLGAGTFFYWFADGLFVGRTTAGRWAFGVGVGEQLRIDVVDSADGTLDGQSLAPAVFPTRRTLEWIRSLDADVAAYEIEQQKDGGEWTTIARVVHTGWSHTLVTPRLDDLSEYAWRVTPRDEVGNEGTAVALAAEKIVRSPEAPSYSVTFDPGTTRITVAAA